MHSFKSNKKMLIIFSRVCFDHKFLPKKDWIHIQIAFLENNMLLNRVRDKCLKINAFDSSCNVRLDFARVDVD